MTRASDLFLFLFLLIAVATVVENIPHPQAQTEASE